MSSQVINREIINALRDKESYKLYPDHGVAEHKHKFSKDEGQIIIALKPQEGEGWETILHGLNTLGDACIDTYIAVMAIGIERNGVESGRMRKPFLIDPDDILAVCGKEKSHGVYTAGQRAEVTKHLKTLSQAHVIASYPRAKKRGPLRKGEDPTTIRVEGALIDLLSFKIGEYNTITGDELWAKREISIGQWVDMIPDMSNKTATMLRRVLAYSAKNERYQKRIGIYLTFMFRINAQKGGTFPSDITMGALLEGAGIVAPRERGQFREAIERALEHLKRDNVIGHYWKVVDASETGQEIQREVQEHAHGWFDSYLRQKWNFMPPEYLKQQYKNLLKYPE